MPRCQCCQQNQILFISNLGSVFLALLVHFHLVCPFMSTRDLSQVLLPHSLSLMSGGKKISLPTVSKSLEPGSLIMWHVTVVRRWDILVSLEQWAFTQAQDSLIAFSLSSFWIISAYPWLHTWTAHSWAGLRVCSRDRHHKQHLGTVRKEILGPCPTPTKSENLGMGPDMCFHKSLGSFWCRLKFENHWLRETDSLWERGLIWGRIYFHSNNGSLAKGQVRWTSRIYQMPEKEGEEK